MAAACLLVLTASACSDADDQDDAAVPSSSPSQSSTAPDTDTDKPDDDATTGSSASMAAETAALLRAASTGLDAVADSTVYSVESESDGWEVEVVTPDGTKHEMLVSSDGDSVVKGPRADGRDAKYVDRIQAAELDHQQAVDVILDEVPGARFKELNLDDENGTIIWEADVLDESGAARSLEIDAASGEVLENKPDD